MAKKDVRRIVFNWKENPETLREALRLFSVIGKTVRGQKNKNVEVVACPPFVYLTELSKKLSLEKADFSLGAQDIFWENGGAYTGEIGPLMLHSIGKNIRYAIVGHSERRRWLHETDEMINKKLRAALAVGLRVILCVGEPVKVRKRGISAARQFIKNQLKKDLQGIENYKLKIGNLIIAYEPIWAIGTGRNCPPAEALATIQFIKKEISHIFANRQSPIANRSLPVLYGGSVSGRTVLDYLCYHEITGVLVGGASLRAHEVIKIIEKSSQQN